VFLTLLRQAPRGVEQAFVDRQKVEGLTVVFLGEVPFPLVVGEVAFCKLSGEPVETGHPPQGPDPCRAVRACGDQHSTVRIESDQRARLVLVSQENWRARDVT